MLRVLVPLPSLFFIAFAIPSDYDARALRPRCTAWSNIADQGDVATCCSFAMATALSARECMRDGRNTMYAPQQIWDCSGPGISDVQNGTLLQRLIGAMGDVTSPYSAYFLVPRTCAPVYIQSSPNLTRCAQTFSSCGGTEIIPPIEASSTFRLSTFSGPNDYGVILAGRYMMMEIMQSGPVIGVLTLPNIADRERFQTLQPDTIFVPGSATVAPSYHCLVVYGWGEDESTGVRFWRVQNSYGRGWSDGGVGRIARGTLERDWRSVSTHQRACGGNTTLCIYPPATPVSDETSNQSAKPFYYPHFVTEKKMKRERINDELLLLPNAAIVGLTVVSSLLIAGILFSIARPSNPAFFAPRVPVYMF